MTKTKKISTFEKVGVFCLLSACRMWAIIWVIVAAVSAPNFGGGDRVGTWDWDTNILISVMWLLVAGCMLIRISGFWVRLPIYLGMTLFLYFVGLVAIGSWILAKDIPGREGSDMLCNAMIGVLCTIPLVLGSYLHWWVNDGVVIYRSEIRAGAIKME